MINTDRLHARSFPIPCLGACPVLIDWKSALISLTRYAISGQSDTKTNSSSRYICQYGFIRIQVHMNHYRSLEMYTHFIHRQSATNY